MKKMVTTELTGPMSFEAKMSTGHVLVMDAGDDAGGQNKGPRPYHLVLAALTGCMGMDVISILRKKRQHISRMWMEVDAERSEEHPKVYTKVNLLFHLSGKNIDPEAIRRSIELSETKYCSVSANLRGLGEVATDFVIHDEE